MEKTFIYFQPEYVSKFRCNGQLCQANCCKYWNIEIDKKTYNQYSSIRPKKQAKEVTQQIKYLEKEDQYLIQLDEKRACPFLTKDNWCSIQRKYGENFLSKTCSTYPRRTYNLGEFFERSLSLTCPLVADLLLIPEK